MITHFKSSRLISIKKMKKISDDAALTLSASFQSPHPFNFPLFFFIRLSQCSPARGMHILRCWSICLVIFRADSSFLLSSAFLYYCKQNYSFSVKQIWARIENWRLSGLHKSTTILARVIWLTHHGHQLLMLKLPASGCRCCFLTNWLLRSICSRMICPSPALSALWWLYMTV